MMTNNKKAKNWKFLLTLPLVGLCFTFMSASPTSDERVRKGNITTYKGNKIEWSGTKGKIGDKTEEKYNLRTESNDHIIKYNNKIVKTLQVTDFTDFHGYADPFAKNIATTISQSLEKIKNDFPSEIAQLQLVNLVLDKEGNPKYYDVLTMGENPTDPKVGGINKYPEVIKQIDKVLSNPQLVNPNKLISENDYVLITVGLAIKTISFTVKPVKPESFEKEVNKQQGNEYKEWREKRVEEMIDNKK